MHFHVGGVDPRAVHRSTLRGPRRGGVPRGRLRSGTLRRMDSRTVIICDDADSYRRVLRMLLAPDERWDVVAEASNGREAIARVRDHRPHLLLLDVSMPVLGGIEALPELRAVSPDTCILLVTGFLGHAVSSAAEEHGVTAVVDKADGLEAVRAALDLCAEVTSAP